LKKEKVTFFWFRRDLRLENNTGLYHALNSGTPVIPLFIFDTLILGELKDSQDKRVNFIPQELVQMQEQLLKYKSSLLVKVGEPEKVWQKLLQEWNIQAVYANTDYEPYATKRDQSVRKLLKKAGINFQLHKDQVIFETDEILKDNDEPYSVYTPYKNKWLDQLDVNQFSKDNSQDLSEKYYHDSNHKIPALEDFGFESVKWQYPDRSMQPDVIKSYHNTRDYPADENGTSRLGIHLRFGTISIRKLVKKVKERNSVFLSELVWREFFMMILYHHPRVVDEPYKEKYKNIAWINDESAFNKWCDGMTGYPMVDAGMRQLNETGYMHNRVRMITASFLTKHLLIDWRWGERYFAEKLLDYEGLNMKDLASFDYMVPPKAADALKDGLLDVAYVGYSVSSLSPLEFGASGFGRKLSETAKLNYIDLNPDAVRHVSKLVPCGVAYVPPGVLKGQTKEHIGITKSLCFTCDLSVPDRVVTEIARLVYEHAHEFVKYVPVGKVMSKDTMCAIGRPGEEFHPAMWKFMQKHGIRNSALLEGVPGGEKVLR